MTNMKPALNTVIGSSVPSAAVAPAAAAELVVDQPTTPDSSVSVSYTGSIKCISNI